MPPNKKHRTIAEKLAGKNGRPTKYLKKYAQEMMDYYVNKLADCDREQTITWFDRDGNEQSRQVPALERNLDKGGKVQYVQKPVVAPTLEEFATKLGVVVNTLYNWAEDHPEFAEAMHAAKQIQSVIYQRMTATGAYPAAWGIFVMKNNFGWTDKSEVRQTGSVTIQFDSQDEDL